MVATILAKPTGKTDTLGPRFRAHVAFDTTSSDLSKNSGITLSARHNGFQAQRRSKTFMVGVDENKYSQSALEWLLTTMVDDHDTVVCVRVIEKDVKPSHNAAYKKQARDLLQAVIGANKLDKAVCLILEYQFGRLGSTFDTMVSWAIILG
jgi:molybdopterin-guanine dinucleotide biosynthesis protein A